MAELQDGGIVGMAGVYYAGVRTQPQLIGCALTQEPRVSLIQTRDENSGER